MTLIEHDPNEKPHEAPSRARKTLDFFLCKYQDMVERRNSEQLDKFYARVDRAAEQTLLNQGTDGKKAIFTPEDYLLNGELEKYAQAKYGTTAPYMWLQLPIDVLTIPVVNGRLPDVNRSAPGELGFKDFDEDDEKNLFLFASTEGRRAWTKTFLTVSSIAMLASLVTLKAHFDWPSYTEIQYGMHLSPLVYYGGGALNMAAYLVKAAMAGGAAVVSAAVTAIGGVGIAILASNFQRDVAFTNAFNRELPNIKFRLTDKFSQPTRQGRFLWKNDTVNYVNAAKSYMRMAYQLVDRLKGQPHVGLGLSTGKLEERGRPYSPRAGVLVGPDREGMTQHFLISGFTGAGKTRLGLTPISIAYLSASKKLGQKSGIIVFDAKGILATSIREAMPEDLKGLYITYSAHDGGVGLDLLKPLIPSQIGQVFIAQAYQKSGGGKESGKWINGAGANVEQAAEILRHAAKNPALLADIWKNRDYTYYSLLGILALTTEDALRNTVVRVILEKALEDPTAFPGDVIEAARGLEKLGSLAVETRTSYTSNIQDVLGLIAGKGNLTRRFASGEISGETFQPIDIIFEGGMVGVAISPADEQEGGALVANLIKTIVYTLAQQRDTAASRAREEILRIEAYANGVFAQLQRNYEKLSQVKNFLRKPETRDKANSLMNSLYPASDVTGDWDTLDLRLFEHIVEEKLTAVKIDSARYTKTIRRSGLELMKARKEVEALREKLQSENCDPTVVPDATTPRIQELVKTRDQTQKSSLLCVIDEYHGYVTSSGGIAADTFFLSIARSTGTTVFAAVQTIDAIADKIGQTATDTLLSNFVNKLFFKTNNDHTKEYASKQSGTGVYDRMWIPNAWSTFPALINELGIAKPRLMFGRMARKLFGFMNLKGGIVADNSLSTPFRDFDLGYRDHVEAAQHEDNEAAAMNETHNRNVARMDAMEKADTTFQEKPYMTPDDIGNLAKDHAFAIWSRGGNIFMEELDMSMGIMA